MTYNPKYNSLIELYVVSFGLGILSTSIIISLFIVHSRYTPLCIYLLSLITYFILEFCNTYRYQTSKVTSRSFLIYGNKGNFEFWLCQLFTICEFLIELKRSFGFETYVPPEFINSIIRIIGFCMIILGLYIRSLAMKTCGESFSHYIHTDDNNQPKLITHGIYAYLRHPSYFGFWWFSIGIQVFLRNPISLVLSIIVLRSFFTTRIKFEEYFLIQKIFGIDYIKYKQRVGIWIPLVKDPIIYL